VFARVALDAGILELVGREIRESGERLVYQEPNTGALYDVDRPATWTKRGRGWICGGEARQAAGI
jgi:hypothetical protein